MESKGNLPDQQVKGAKRKLDPPQNQPDKKKICKPTDAEIIAVYQEKDYEKCLTMICDSLKANSTNTHLKILQASCWTMLKRSHDETYALLNKIIEEEPKNSFAYYGIGFKRYTDGELKESIEHLHKAIELNPTNSMQKAVELKQKALRITDAIADAKEKFEANQFEKALRVIEAATYIDFENPKIHQKLMTVRDEFIKDVLAKLVAEVEIDVSLSYKQLLVKKKIQRAEVLIQNNKLKTAEKVIERITALDPNAEGLLFIKGFFHYMSGSLKEAIVLLEGIVKLDVDYEKTIEILRKAKKLDELMNNAADKMVEKKHVESIELLTQIVAIDENNKRINQAAYFQRALGYFSLGSSTAAFADFKRFEAMDKATKVASD